MVLFGDLKNDLICLLSRLCPMNTTTRSLNLFFELCQIYIHVLDGMQTDIGPDLTQLFPLRKFRHTRGTPADKTTRRLLHRRWNTGGHMLAIFFEANISRDFVAHFESSLDANRSIMCMACMLEPSLCKPPATFIRQPGSHMTTVSAPLATISLTLFSIIARLTSGKVTVNEPPKPQQVSSSFNCTNSKPLTLVNNVFASVLSPISRR